MKTMELTLLEKCFVYRKKIISGMFGAIGGYHVVKRFVQPAITIIVYHRIIADDHNGIKPYLSVTESNLRNQIRFYKREYLLLSLDEAIEQLQNCSIERKSLVITFDDGYEDNYSLGMKVFQEEGVRPAVFITTGPVDRQADLWPDRLRRLILDSVIESPVKIERASITIKPKTSSRIQALRAAIAYVKTLDLIQRESFLNDLENIFSPPATYSSLMLDWNQVGMLASRGVTIGSHTVNHPFLAQIPEDVAGFEIGESKRILEEKTGRKINMFAYPNGKLRDFTPKTVELLRRSGYVAAVTTMRGVNRAGCNPFYLRRTGVYLTDSITDIQCKLALESLLR
jgi:peptidoglycan/xylan/chitin deacetylase (PgdA/CDA1 family)